jgi:site-specific DNA recombinase
MKRVWNLYRVSTDRQVEKDDIPMQKTACRSFIDSKQDWTLAREFSELGVSGFKKSAAQRDKLEQIRQGAINKEFDVLLVWMYDRLGRKHEETPFVVEWFVKQGVEVWSVMEGQRTFDNHVDSLTNYITFWQASGESIKTSMRVKEKVGQLNDDGEYMGGTPPYGYEVYDTGIKHVKRDKNVKRLRINPTEAELVRSVFNLVLTKGYGASRIAQWLNDNGHRTRNGSSWRHNYVTRMLRNSIVCGYKMYGYFDDGHINRDAAKTQPFNAEYVIVSKEDFEKVQEIVSSRHLAKREDSDVVVPTKSKLLLSGIVKCGYCGGNLSADYSQKSHKRKDGAISKWYSFRYTCKHGKDKAHVEHDCSQFGSIKYEEQVENVVKDFIRRIDKQKFVNEMTQFRGTVVDTKKQSLAQLKKEIEEDYTELKAIKGLVVKVELGQSRLSFETVEGMLIDQEKKVAEKNNSIQRLESELGDSSIELDDFRRVLDDLDDWIERYDASDLDTRKMMMARIIKSISFKKDEIDITLILPLEKSIIEEDTSTVVGNMSDTNSKRVRKVPLYEERIVASLVAKGETLLSRMVG